VKTSTSPFFWPNYFPTFKEEKGVTLHSPLLSLGLGEPALCPSLHGSKIGNMIEAALASEGYEPEYTQAAQNYADQYTQ